MNPYLFESALQSENVLIRYESAVVWTLNPDILFLFGDVTRSSPVRYRERQRKMKISNSVAGTTPN